MRKLILLMIIFCSVAAGLNAQVKYQGEINLGYGAGIGDNKLSKFTANTIHGIRINPYLFIGAGVGYDAATCEFKSDIEGIELELGKPKVIPIFANVKGYYPVNNKFSLFLGMSFGYGTYGEEDAEWIDFSEIIGEKTDPWLFGFYGKGGVYYSPEIGFNYRLSRKIGLNFAVGYQAQVFNYQLSLGPKGDIEQFDFDKTAGSLSFRVGLTW